MCGGGGIGIVVVVCVCVRVCMGGRGRGGGRRHAAHTHLLIVDEVIPPVPHEPRLVRVDPCVVVGLRAVLLNKPARRDKLRYTESVHVHIIAARLLRGCAERGETPSLCARVVAPAPAE